MIRKITMIVVMGILFFLYACKGKITGITESEPEPGGRNYVWTVDTLFHTGMNYIDTIWGSSPNDVWAVGAGGTFNDRLLHYDGNNWSTYGGGPIFCCGNVLFGFGAEDIWMGGSADFGDPPGASIWHYDGKEWSRNFTWNNSYETYNGANVIDIWGSSSKDIYACGDFYYESGNHWGSFILHYDGIQWKEVVRTKYRPDLCSEFHAIRKENHRVYIWDYRLNWVSGANDTLAFLELDGNQLKEIYANSSGNIGGNLGMAGFKLIDNKLYFDIGNDVFLYRGGIFIKQFSIDHPNYWSLLGGRNEKDIFLDMSDGLAHYNGTDIQYIYYFPSNRAYSFVGSPMVFEKEIFFCMWDQSNGFQNMILHGKFEE